MEHVRVITREFETGDTAVLHVEARSGAVIVEAHASPVVRVQATVRVWSDHESEADEAAALVARGIEQDEHRVMVRAPTLPQSEGWNLWAGRRGSRIDFTINVPRQTAVRVLTRSGAVRIAGTEGRVHLETGSGRAQVDNVRGHVAIIARSGSLQVERITGDLKIDARSGRVDVRRVDGMASIETRSGSTEVRDVTGDLTVQAHTGALTIADAGACVRARTHTGAIRYSGRIEGDFDMAAKTGLIHLTVDPDRPFYIDAESHIGSIRSDLPPRRAPGTRAGAPPDGTAPKVRLRTHTGAIRISRL
jgi:hypothetical protein